MHVPASTTSVKLCGVTVRVRTIPTEQPPPIGEVMPILAGRGMLRGQRHDPTAVSPFTRPRAATYLSSSSSIYLTRLSGHRSRPTATQKIW
jgi:hypothetical protein